MTENNSDQIFRSGSNQEKKDILFINNLSICFRAKLSFADADTSIWRSLVIDFIIDSLRDEFFRYLFCNKN